VLDRLETETAVVPSLWHLEAANVLALAERKGRITAAGTAEFIAMVETLSIDVDQETPFRAFAEIFALARRQGLTAYDAAYLELAMRSGIPLATKDLALAAGARSLGVGVLGL
jgi:predicted nucleic acid-binding protein